MKGIDYELQWDEYYPKIYGYYFRRVSSRQDVEDLTSITMTIFFDKISSTEINNYIAYLWKIAHFQLMNYIRNKSKAPVYVSIDEEFEVDDSIESTTSDYLAGRKQDLMKCIQKHSSQEDYELIQRIVVEDHKAVDIAQELSVKADSIRQRFHRVLKKLRLQCSNVWSN